MSIVYVEKVVDFLFQLVKNGSKNKSVLKKHFNFQFSISSLTANQFAEAYQRNAIATSISSAAELLLSPDKLISLFHSCCSAILDSVPPLK